MKDLGEGALHWIRSQIAKLIAFVILKYEQAHKKEITMNPAVYAVVAVIAILFVLACRHIYHATIGGGGCCGGGGDCPACRERKMKLHGGLKK